MNDFSSNRILVYFRAILVLPIALFSVFSVFAQEPIITWQQCYGGSEWDGYGVAENSLVLLEDAYVFIVHSLSNDGQVSSNHGERDIWFVKVGFDGDIVWEHSLGGSSTEYPAKLIATSDGGFLVLGSTGSNDGDVSGNHGWFDYWAVKTDSEGNILWQNCLGGSYNDEPYDVLETEDGGYLIIGYTSSSDGDISLFYGFWDIWIVKLNTIGELLWDRSYGGSLLEYGTSIKPTYDGGYLIVSTVTSNDSLVNCNLHGMEDVWLVKLDGNMEIVWQKCYGGTFSDGGIIDIVVLDDGFLMSGSTSSNDGDVSGLHGPTDDQPDIWVVRVDEFGELLWQKCLGGYGWDVSKTVTQTSDGNFIVVGYSNSVSGDMLDCNHWSGYPPSFDAWVVKLSGEGDILWRKCLGGEVYQKAFDIALTSPGHMMVLCVTGPDITGGDVDCDLHGKSDIWLVELFDTITGKIDHQTYTDKLKVYPNPAQDYVVFEIPKATTNNNLNNKSAVIPNRGAGQGGGVRNPPTNTGLTGKDQGTSSGHNSKGIPHATTKSQAQGFGITGNAHKVKGVSHSTAQGKAQGFGMTAKKGAVVVIVNVFGQQVAELPLTSEKTVWDTREVQSGIYFYRVDPARAGEAKVLSGKIVVQ